MTYRPQPPEIRLYNRVSRVYNALPDDPAEIAHTVRRAKVTGEPRSPEECPWAVWMGKKGFVAKVIVTATYVFLPWSNEGELASTICVLNPLSLVEFIKDVDRGRWPELIRRVDY